MIPYLELFIVTPKYNKSYTWINNLIAYCEGLVFSK